MRDVVVCEPVRTAVGKYAGALQDVDAAQLGALTVRALLERTKLDGGAVDEVILGHCFPSSEAPAIGRVVALESGLPATVTGMQLDRRCGSGLQAVLNAVMQVASGASDLVIAGGVESMSNAVHYTTKMRRGSRLGDVTMYDSLTRGRITAGGRGYPIPGGMIETAENLRRTYSIPREEQDRYALRSHERATNAQVMGKFNDEIVPIRVRRGRTDELFVVDEHPRADATIGTLAALPALSAASDAEATVTAGNASGQNDAAAVCIVTERHTSDQFGLRAMVRVRGWAVAGVEPNVMGLGPVPSTEAALRRADLAMSDMDLIELNEAFAAQVLACTREWKFADADFDRLNVNGSGISLGHPVGATGARILATLAHEMARRQARFALETMCIGGGQGIAAVFERVS